MAYHLSYDALNRLIDNRASVVEEARARRHLTTCGRCRSECEWLARIRGYQASVHDLIDVGMAPCVSRESD